jgi:hypothetical protein
VLFWEGGATPENIHLGQQHWVGDQEHYLEELGFRKVSPSIFCSSF